jgi:hypothetical protein
MTHSTDQPRPRPESEVEKFLADLEEDQADRRELEDDDDLKRTDRSSSTSPSTDSSPSD